MGGGFFYRDYTRKGRKIEWGELGSNWRACYSFFFAVVVPAVFIIKMIAWISFGNVSYNLVTIESVEA